MSFIQFRSTSLKPAVLQPTLFANPVVAGLLDVGAKQARVTEHEHARARLAFLAIVPPAWSSSPPGADSFAMPSVTTSFQVLSLLLGDS